MIFKKGRLTGQPLRRWMKNRGSYNTVTAPVYRLFDALFPSADTNPIQVCTGLPLNAAASSVSVAAFLATVLKLKIQ